MRELEAIDQSYLFKLKKSKNVINLIYKHHGLVEWTTVHPGWEAKDDDIQLDGWSHERRVMIVRRKISNNTIIGIESNNQLSLIDAPDNIHAFEYSVLITEREDDLASMFYHYRDRADCENNFDELKNQWGWGGYTTKDVKSCRLMSRIIALIYNWWNLYVRLVLPECHHEAITSRPLLLSSVGRMTKHSHQKTVKITSVHGKTKKLAQVYNRLSKMFSHLKAIAPQLTSKACWHWLLNKIIERVATQESQRSPPDIPALP